MGYITIKIVVCIIHVVLKMKEIYLDYHSIRTFSDLFFLMERKYSCRVAFRWVDDDENVQQKTYKDFCTDIRGGVSYLCEICNFVKEQHVAILARNSYDYVVMLFSCFVAGMVVVPLNLQKSTEEILKELSDSDTNIVLHDGEFVDRETNFIELFSGQLLPLDGYAYCSKDVQWADQSPLTLASIYYTSGTTARSKGVMLSQRCILESYPEYASMEDSCRLVYGMVKDTPISWFLATPLYHVIGFGQMLCSCISGCEVNINRNTKYFFRDLLMLPSNMTCITPAFIQPIERKFNHKKSGFLGGLKVICSAGAPIQENTVKTLLLNGIYVIQFYGLTEVFSGVTLNCSQEIDKIASIGKECLHPMWHNKCSIIESELCIHGASLMMGYYNNPEATAEVIDEKGWFHSGDFARQDADGYFYLVGRKKNLIILSGGENVNPEEIETQLLINEDVLEVVVREQDNRIVAEVFCEETSRRRIEAFVTELNRTLPMYKRISYVEFRETPFERTATGKIKR